MIITVEWLFRNCWIGIIVKNQQTADEYIPILFQIPATVRFVLVKPMLEPLNIRKYLQNRNTCNLLGKCPDDSPYIKCRECPANKIDLVIYDSETDPNVRLDWVRDLILQCKNAGVPIFIKNVGKELSNERISDFIF